MIPSTPSRAQVTVVIIVLNDVDENVEKLFILVRLPWLLRVKKVIKIDISCIDKNPHNYLRNIIPPIKLGEYTPCLSVRSAEWKPLRFTHVLNAGLSSAKSVAT
jgi:hypothetical protein